MSGKVSRRGVYYDLSISPYTFKTLYGDILRFRSAKKLEIFEREIEKELKRFNDLMDRHDMQHFIPRSVKLSIIMRIHNSLYERVEVNK